MRARLTAPGMRCLKLPGAVTLGVSLRNNILPCSVKFKFKLNSWEQSIKPFRVKNILDLLASGATTAEILVDYSYLEADDIKAALFTKQEN